jgi:pyruvate, orthophosphate dikinase
VNNEQAPDLYPIGPGVVLPPGGPAAVGGKAWNLMRMAAAGLRVPPGFVLPTGWCQRLHAPGSSPALDASLAAALQRGIAGLEKVTGLGFGSERRPLLVSVRSGAPVSMPGMLETVLDIGLNQETVEGLIRQTGNPRLAWDSYRRLVRQFASVVAGLPGEPFDAVIATVTGKDQEEPAGGFDHLALRAITLGMLERYKDLAGEPFPEDVYVQLNRAAAAVFASWGAPKAVTYRRLNGIADSMGTAVAIQTMVFGNAGGASGAGVGFTRDPATGARTLYVDFQFNGQGEDVVAGRQVLNDNERLRRRLPLLVTELETTCHTLEALFGDAQDFEFTLQSGTLYLLQTRTAKTTLWAALRIAVDLVEEGLITSAEALARLRSIDLSNVTRSRLAVESGQMLATARVACPGIASGAIALSPEAAERMVETGQKVILVRREIATEDIAGLSRAEGTLTATGGRTSHAAVVARQLGKVCLVGCSALSIDLARRQCRIGDRVLDEGEVISLDGNEGRIFAGALEVLTERPDRELAIIHDWQRAAAA